MTIRTVLVDDEPLATQGLQLRLHRREPDLLVELVLETGTGGERLLEELAELRILLAVCERRSADGQR